MIGGAAVLLALWLFRAWALWAARRPKSWANRVRAILAYEGDPWAK